MWKMWESPIYTFEEEVKEKGKIVKKPFHINVTYSAPRNLDDPGKDAPYHCQVHKQHQLIRPYSFCRAPQSDFLLLKNSALMAEL